MILANRVYETTTTQGTGAINLAGSVTGFQSFVAGAGNGAVVNYLIDDGTDWEIGIGTVTAGSPDTLSRDTILNSTNSDAAVNWGSGTRNVRLVVSAEKTVSTDSNETISGDKTFSGAVDLSGATLSLAAGEIDTADLANVSVTTAKLADDAVTAAKLADGAVTAAKINNVAYNKNFLHVQDQKTSGTNGGTSSAGDQTRDINTVVTNNITGASLATNQITLPAGTYFLNAIAPSYGGQRTKLKLRNVTDSTNDLIGTSSYTASGDISQNYDQMSGLFTIAAEKDFEIVHYFEIAKAADGLGVQTGLAGIAEIYTDVKIWKVS